MMSKKWLRACIGLLLVGLLLVPVLTGGCAKPATGPAKTLKIGTVMPISGPWGAIGLCWDRGFDLAADKVNEQGGLKVGGDTYLVQFIHEDSKTDPAASTSATTKLIHQDKVNFVFGAIVESASEAIQKVAQEAGVLHVLTYSTIPEPYAWGAGGDVPLMVLLCPPTCRGYGVVFDYFANAYPNVKTMVHSENLFPHEPLMVLAADMLKDRGIEVVGTERFDPAAADFYPWATACLKYNPDAISVDHSGPEQMGKQIKALREQGFKGPIISLAPISPVFLLAGAGAENCYDIVCQSPYAQAPDVPAAMKAVVDGWNTKYAGEPFIDDALMAYDCVSVLLQGIEKANSLDSNAIMNALESMNKPGNLNTVFGPGYMGGKQTIGANRELLRTVAISVIQGNDIKNVKWAMPELP
jgi:branched-chain amino acid transport system substrate-binding protein